MKRCIYTHYKIVVNIIPYVQLKKQHIFALSKTKQKRNIFVKLFHHSVLSQVKAYEACVVSYSVSFFRFYCYYYFTLNNERNKIVSFVYTVFSLSSKKTKLNK